MTTVVDGTTGVNAISSSLYGTSGANKLLQLDGAGKLPAIDISQGTGLVTTPSGTVIYVAQNTPPTGFVKANGALLNRTTYAALFAAIGTTFGAGDGSTTFGIPDLRGEFVRGWDDARGVDSGRSFGTAQAQDMQPHTHTIATVSNSGGSNGIWYNANASLAVYTSQNTGSTGTTETRPRNVALLACIKY